MIMEKTLQTADILKILEKRGAELAAGKNGLNRAVKCLDVLEQPQLDGWVREGAFFITTGYVVRNDKAALLNLIQILYDRQAAALAIKTRYFRNFPKETLELSDRLGFPLILVEDSVSTVDLIFSIMEALLSASQIPLDAYWRLRDEKDLRLFNTHLFLDLILARYDKWNEMEYRINALHWPSEPVRLALINIASDPDRQFVSREKMDLVYDTIQNIMGKKQIRTAIILKNNECICIFPENYTRSDWTSVFSDLRKHILNTAESNVFIGISRKIDQYQNVPCAYTDAQDAIKIGKSLQISKPVVEIESVQFEQALLRISKDPFFQQRAYDIFSTLKQYDSAHDSRLMETLEVFVCNSAIRKAAAKQLHLHRNTLAYHIKKIEELLHINLSDNQDLMLITFLLHIRNYL